MPMPSLETQRKALCLTIGGAFGASLALLATAGVGDSSPGLKVLVGIGAMLAGAWVGARGLTWFMLRNAEPLTHPPVDDVVPPELVEDAAIVDPFELSEELREAASPEAQDAMHCVEECSREQLDEPALNRVLGGLTPSASAELRTWLEAVATDAREFGDERLVELLRRCKAWL